VKDPTVPSADNRKKIMFYDSEDRQNKLRIRCDFDGITQSQFFRMMLTGYIEKDPLVYEFLKQCKEKYQGQGVQKRNKIEQIKKAADKITKMFALNEEEKEDIFDIIETETGI